MSQDKIPFSTQVDRQVVERVRATVRALQRRFGAEVTLSGFVSDALDEHVQQAEKEHNNGQPFPDPAQRLTTGPRVQSNQPPQGDSTESPPNGSQ